MVQHITSGKLSIHHADLFDMASWAAVFEKCTVYVLEPGGLRFFRSVPTAAC